MLFFVFFIGLHWLLSGLLEIVLTRFLRYQESYDFGQFKFYLIDHYESLLDGGIWYTLYLILFWGISLNAQMDLLNRSGEQLQKQISKTDLSRLSKEVNPHFLFNAMNSIAMKVRLNENKTAIAMISALNDLLRLSLYGENYLLIPLSEELELLEKYILIERSRFGDRFSWTTDVPAKFNNCILPRMILQPLVENAFKHGMSHGHEHMILRLEVEEVERSMSIRIFNSEVGNAKINYASSSVGLPNIVNRLRQIYKSEFQFKSFIESDGVSFQILIPIRT